MADKAPACSRAARPPLAWLGWQAKRGGAQAQVRTGRRSTPGSTEAQPAPSRSRDDASGAIPSEPAPPNPVCRDAPELEPRLARLVSRRSFLHPVDPRASAGGGARQGGAFARYRRAFDPSCSFGESRPRTARPRMGRSLPRARASHAARNAPRPRLRAHELQEALAFRRARHRRPELGLVVRRIHGCSPSTRPSRRTGNRARLATTHLAGAQRLATPRPDWPK
jgi:hypothetical protein